MYSLWHWCYSSENIRIGYSEKKNKQGIKSSLKPVSTNSNITKETNPVKTTTSVEVASTLSRSTETEIVNENEFLCTGFRN